MPVEKPSKEQQLRWIRELITRYGESPYLLERLKEVEELKCQKSSTSSKKMDYLDAISYGALHAIDRIH